MTASHERDKPIPLTPGGRVTLRARLTAAFLAVVLGPVLLGAGFVAVTVGAVSEGRHLGYAYAVEPVDLSLVDRLATAGGAAVTVLPAASRLSTEHGTDLRQVADLAADLHGGAMAETENGRCVRRVDQGPSQP